MSKLRSLAVFLVLSAPAWAAHTVSLTWTQTTDPVQLNCVFRSATKGGENPQNPLFCSTAPITSYTDQAVVDGDTWYYTVDAVSAKGVASPFSNETSPMVIPLLSPTNLSGAVN